MARSDDNSMNACEKFASEVENKQTHCGKLNSVVLLLVNHHNRGQPLYYSDNAFMLYRIMLLSVEAENSGYGNVESSSKTQFTQE